MVKAKEMNILYHMSYNDLVFISTRDRRIVEVWRRRGSRKSKSGKKEVGVGSNEVMECEIGIDYTKIGVDVCPTYPVIITRKEKSLLL